MKENQVLPGPLVSAEWLHQNMHRPEVVLLDASLTQTQNSTATHVQQPLQLPGARYFDLENKFSDRQSHLPHMLPSEADFTCEAQQLGINKDSVVVVYDNRGIYSSPRVWWMFKAMGHEQVAVLNGGLPGWLAAGYDTEPKIENSNTIGNFTAKYNKALVASKEDVLKALPADNYTVIDARSAARFQGRAPEPRPGLRLGHMPNAVNIPFEMLLKNGAYLPKAQLAKIFEAYHLTGKQLIYSCGSGVTACIVALAAVVAGYPNFAVYDGSWSEWGLPGDLPVVAEV